MERVVGCGGRTISNGWEHWPSNGDAQGCVVGVIVIGCLRGMCGERGGGGWLVGGERGVWVGGWVVRGWLEGVVRGVVRGCLRGMCG